MNKSKHTPGPWSCGRKSTSRINKILSLENRMYVNEIASMIKTKDELANAKLIAAAPELLSMVIGHVKDMSMCDPTDYKNLCREEIPIIEKATGQKIDDILKGE